MNETAVTISLRILSAHLAKCAIVACYDEPPPHLSLAVSEFRKHFQVRFYLKDIEEYTSTASCHSLESSVRASFQHVPEILAWGARKTSPINLDHLAKAVALSYWKENEATLIPRILASVPPVRPSFWKRFAATLRMAA